MDQIQQTRGIKMERQRTKMLVLGAGEGLDINGQLKKHILRSASDISYEQGQDAIRFMLGELGVLVHDEHDRIVFTPGNRLHSYSQVEFNPHDGSIGRVFD